MNFKKLLSMMVITSFVFTGFPVTPLFAEALPADEVIPKELQFYRTNNIPVPALCPNCRYYARIAKRNPAKLWSRTCN